MLVVTLCWSSYWLAAFGEERLKPKAPAGLHWISSPGTFEIWDVASKWVKADLVSCVARVTPLQTAFLGKLHTFFPFLIFVVGFFRMLGFLSNITPSFWAESQNPCGFCGSLCYFSHYNWRTGFLSSPFSSSWLMDIFFCFWNKIWIRHGFFPISGHELNIINNCLQE